MIPAMVDCDKFHFSLHTSDGRVISPAAGKTVIMGQCEGSDIRLSNPGPFEDVAVAKIIPSGSGGWCLVRLSRDYPVSVSGRAVAYVHHLEDKDNIEAGTLEPTVRFRIGPGAQPPQTIVHRGLSRRGVAVLTTAFILLVLSAAWWVRHVTGRDSLSEQMLAAAQASLYRLEVDSLFLFEGDSLMGTYAYPAAPAGTAFLTADSLLVTARHCVEPWLNAVDVAGIPELAGNDNPAIRMALQAETYNVLAGDGAPRMTLVSGVTLTDSRGRKIRMRSSAFTIDRSRDEIVELGSYDTDLYWRNIQARYGRSDMMLGDAVACRMSRAGSIVLADSSVLAEELHQRRGLTFMGFPLSQGRDETAEVETAELSQPLARLAEDPAHFFMLAHGGRLAPGYSGGPVLMLSPSSEDGFVAAGVISVLDRENNHRSYSVPATEIPKP